MTMLTHRISVQFLKQEDNRGVIYSYHIARTGNATASGKRARRVKVIAPPRPLAGGRRGVVPRGDPVKWVRQGVRYGAYLRRPQHDGAGFREARGRGESRLGAQPLEVGTVGAKVVPKVARRTVVRRRRPVKRVRGSYPLRRKLAKKKRRGRRPSRPVAPPGGLERRPTTTTAARRTTQRRTTTAAPETWPHVSEAWTPVTAPPPGRAGVTSGRTVGYGVDRADQIQAGRDEYQRRLAAANPRPPAIRPPGMRPPPPAVHTPPRAAYPPPPAIRAPYPARHPQPPAIRAPSPALYPSARAVYPPPAAVPTLAPHPSMPRPLPSIPKHVVRPSRLRLPTGSATRHLSSAYQAQLRAYRLRLQQRQQMRAMVTPPGGLPTNTHQPQQSQPHYYRGQRPPVPATATRGSAGAPKPKYLRAIGPQTHGKAYTNRGGVNYWGASYGGYEPHVGQGVYSRGVTPVASTSYLTPSLYVAPRPRQLGFPGGAVPIPRRPLGAFDRNTHGSSPFSGNFVVGNADVELAYPIKRRQPTEVVRNLRNNADFVWKISGFTECSRECGGGERDRGLMVTDVTQILI